MKIMVAVKLVPDLVENLEIAPGGTGLDRTYLRLILSEPDEHALEQALLLKDESTDITVVAPGFEEADDDLDGSLGPLLAGLLNLPYVGNVAGLSITEGKATARKEYSGGLIGEMEIGFPAVIGIVA